MQQIQQHPSRRQLCHSTRSSFVFSILMFILIGLDRHGEGAEVGTNNGCPVTQFRCSTTARCVNLNVFCDGHNDCGDNSDEPAQCTHCNRTYYAGTGENYRLLVAWPKLQQMPFLCYLTFKSATQDPPQLLQVRVDTATIGQYIVQQSKGEVTGRCPDGCMQILEGELHQPKVAPINASGGSLGAWCGASITPRFYYTDSNAVTFVLHLQTIPQRLLQKSKSLLMTGDTSSSITAQQLHPILDLTYKILPRSSAILRYGWSSNLNQLGEPVASTVCSRTFRQCGASTNESECRVQSPGYPGIYPRHAHCLYRISSSSRHVIVLWQNDGRKINLRDWDQPTKDGGQRTSRSTTECEASGDYITIYDGANTMAPVLARFCDGPLPQVVSSSSDVVVEFRSSPLDTIYAASTAIEGFELRVRMMPIDGRTITANTCQWNVTSSGLSRGQLQSALQTWPLRTMCHFRFIGRPDERVWIYFTKYYFEKDKRRPQQQCRNALRIAEGDGTGWDPLANGSSAINGTIRLYCRDTKPPPLCERQLPEVHAGEGSMARPCVAEGFLSRGSMLSVQQHLPEGTAFSPWKFVLFYEFYRQHQDGQSDDERTKSELKCNKVFSVDRNQSVEFRGSVKSPQNVFLFGRGGAPNLKCVYRFEGDETMRVAIEVTRLRLGGHRRCQSHLDPLTHQRRCHISPENNVSSTAFLQLMERPYAGQTAGHEMLIQRDCLCDGLQLPFRYVSSSSVVEVVFNVNAMTHQDDYNDFFFEIAYEFIGGPAAARGGIHLKCASQSELKPIQGPGGIIQLDGLRATGRPNSVCNRQSWFLLPRLDRFFFLSTPGLLMNNQLEGDSCPTKNRIVIYSDGQVDGQPLAVICPSTRPGDDVKLFSPIFGNEFSGHDQDLETSDEIGFGNQSTGGVIIEFIAIQSGSYTLKWLELTRQSVNPFNDKSFVPHLGSVTSPPPPLWFFCATWCPELKACIDSQLWCDGVYDCPSGVDESDHQCHSDDITSAHNPTRISSWTMPKVYWYLIAAGSTLLSLFVVVSSVLVCRENGHHPSKEPEVVASSNPAHISQGSFPPAAVTALNDYVYPPDDNVANVKLVVGGGGVVDDKVTSLYRYDKKLAVS